MAGKDYKERGRERLLYFKHFRALGFSGSPSEAVHYALNYLSHLVTYNDSSGSASVSTGGDHEAQRVIYPKLELPDVFQLSHHSNQVNVLFMKEAIAGTYED